MWFVLKLSAPESTLFPYTTLFRSSEISESVNFCVMEAIKLCRLDTPIIFIEARINLSRFVVTGCAAKTSATVTFPSLNLISLFAFCRSEERFSRNAETDIVCRLLLEKKNYSSTMDDRVSRVIRALVCSRQVSEVICKAGLHL